MKPVQLRALSSISSKKWLDKAKPLLSYRIVVNGCLQIYIAQEVNESVDLVSAMRAIKCHTVSSVSHLELARFVM
jgi:hypothetical protein